MPLKQTNVLSRRFGFKVRPDSRLSTRPFARAIKKPKDKKPKDKKEKRDAPIIDAQALIDEELNTTPPHTRPSTPVFNEDEHLHARTPSKFLKLHAVNSLDLLDKTYAGFVESRDDPEEDCDEYLPRGPPELPTELWCKIAVRSGDGKKMRRMASLGNGFAEAARMHEDNVTPVPA